MRLAALVRARRIACCAAVALAGGIAGCGSPPKTSSCPQDFPSGCPSPPPSWKAEVQPIINDRCVPCHSPTGVESVLNYTSYQGVFVRYPEMRDQLYQCVMPPSTAAQPTEAERETLLTWFVCGAPNN
ncbi:MAG TPA: hypothetical protein VKU41_09865 [Polyangiaceae bacterium]|nr:hypothetical protein [Polyangiaceae bacterium]